MVLSERKYMTRAPEAVQSFNKVCLMRCVANSKKKYLNLVYIRIQFDEKVFLKLCYAISIVKYESGY